MADEAHTTEENLIKFCILDIVSVVCWKKHLQKRLRLPQSNNVVGRCFNNSKQFKINVIFPIINLWFLLSSTWWFNRCGRACSVSSIVYYLHCGEVNNDFILCELLPTLKTGDETFKILDKFLMKMKSCCRCVHIWSRKHDRFSDRRQSTDKAEKSTTNLQCIIHNQQLTSKRMLHRLTDVQGV